MSEELIRRSDAIEAITDISKNYTGKGKRNYHPHIDFLVDALKYDVPTIEPKRGEWIKDICEYDRAYHFKCSVCGEWNGLSVEEWNWTPNFCPNCGARMKGVDDE